jgi:hypothetical protein
MALNKQPISLTFAQGLDTKTDLHQVQAGKMLALSNSVFDVGGELKKRNGFDTLTALPDNTNTYLATLNGGLIAIGDTLNSLSMSTGLWTDKGSLQPVSLSTLPLVRSSTNQTACDSVVASNGLICTVYTDTSPTGSPVYKYVIADSVTGQVAVDPVVIPAVTGTTTGDSRVFLFNQYFLIVTALSTGQLQYLTIPIAAPSTPNAPVAFSGPTGITNVGWFDGVVLNGTFYYTWNNSVVSVASMSAAFVQSSPVTVASASSSSLIAITADITTKSTIYVAYVSGTLIASAVSVAGFSTTLVSLFSPVTVFSLGGLAGVSQVTLAAEGGQCMILFSGQSSEGGGNFQVLVPITKAIVSSTGSIILAATPAIGAPPLSTPAFNFINFPGIVLASKAFIYNSQVYILTTWSSPLQPSYFLINATLSVQTAPVVIAKLAYSNGEGYPSSLVLPSVTVSGASAYFSYLIRDLVASVSKVQAAPNAGNIYSQTGVNAATFTFGTGKTTSVEIASNLSLSGGFINSYDGLAASENNFFLWPEVIPNRGSNFGGGLSAQEYFYQIVYAWTDADGNVHRSAPSVPFSVTVGQAPQGPNTVFTGTFSASSTSMSVSSITGLAGLDPLFDNTTPSNLAAGTYIQNVRPTTLDILPATVGASGGGGDKITAVQYQSVTFLATAAANPGLNILSVSSLAGLYVGQRLIDATTPSILAANTTITALSSPYGANTITISTPATAAFNNDVIVVVDTASVTLYLPTLLVTNKTSPIRIEVYRWSQAQQVYYEVTSVNNPVYNTLTASAVTYVDTANDAAILGNTILYTTGGVIEDLSPPASNILTLFDTRVWLVDAEDPNLLWFSKQIIENVPVEFSDLLTIYIAPSVSETTNSGPVTALSVMDDKLVIFKKNSIFYVNGTGPDNTGANSQYSPPIFIAATVGCANPNSIVFTPMGLMFQSGKGIWLLGRDLSTKYLGAPVEQLVNANIVLSSIAIPTSNQIRFSLNTGTTVIYDYYYDQWGSFTGINPVSSVTYQNLHTFIDNTGTVYQETPAVYLDGTTPTTMSFQTAWFDIAGLQGYERSYYFYLLGTYSSPHLLNVSVYYDYETTPSQTFQISPTNYGTANNLEQWRVFLQRQRCQAFSIEVSEVYDPSKGVAAGAGLSLSGLSLIVGVKRGYRPMNNSHTVG